MNWGTLYYLGGVCEAVMVISAVAGLVMTITAAVWALNRLFDGDSLRYEDDDTDRERAGKRLVRLLAWAALACFALVAVLPDRKSLMAMAIADKTDGERIARISEKGLTALEDFIDCRTRKAGKAEAK